MMMIISQCRPFVPDATSKCVDESVDRSHEKTILASTNFHWDINKYFWVWYQNITALSISNGWQDAGLGQPMWSMAVIDFMCDLWTVTLIQRQGQFVERLYANTAVRMRNVHSNSEGEKSGEDRTWCSIWGRKEVSWTATFPFFINLR